MSTVMQNVTHDTNCQRLHGACTDAHNRTHADAHVHWCAHVPNTYTSTSSTKNSHPTHTCGGSAKPGGIITFQTFNQHKCTDQLLCMQASSPAHARCNEQFRWITVDCQQWQCLTIIYSVSPGLNEVRGAHDDEQQSVRPGATRTSWGARRRTSQHASRRPD